MQQRVLDFQTSMRSDQRRILSVRILSLTQLYNPKHLASEEDHLDFLKVFLILPPYCIALLQVGFLVWHSSIHSLISFYSC